MKLKDYFLILVPSDSKHSFKIKISRKVILLILAILLGFFIFAGYTIYMYLTIGSEIKNLKEVHLKNIRISKQLVSYSVRVKNIEDTIERIKLISSKLSIISSLSDTTRHTPGVVNSLNNTLDDFEEIYQGDYNKVDKKLKEIKHKIGKLEYESVLQEEKYSALSDYLSAQSSLLASTPAIMPAHGWLTSPFGERTDPFTGRVRRHDGLDIAARIGTPILAPADGIVTFAGRKSGYGLMLVLDHGYGITTRYGHLSKILVSHGSQVNRGMLMAAVGNTGRSTGPHLHYEVRLNGIPVNPKKFILDGFWDN